MESSSLSSVASGESRASGVLPQVNLDSPVGRPGRQEALVSVTDDIEDVAVSRHDRAAQTGDLDAQLIHTAQPAARAAVAARAEAGVETGGTRRRSRDYASAQRGCRAA